MIVLLIGAGRRVSLANRFISHGFDVYSYETETNCPISTVATIINGKFWLEPDIREDIFSAIKETNADLILALSDHATPILSSITYHGVVVASGRTNSLCLNKHKFEQKLQSQDFYPNVQANKPVILKPIFGANSKGIYKLSYEDYLNHKNEYEKTHVAQQLIEGFEISVDAYFNKYSKMIDAVPRKRVEIQGGEVSRSTTLSREAYGVVDLTKIVGEQFGLVGPICAQYIIDENNKAYIMEINARFGGGVILSMEAGFDQVQLLKEEYVENKPCLPKLYDWQSNFSMTRYFNEYFYGENNE